MSSVKRISPYKLASKIDELRKFVPLAPANHAESEFHSDYRARRLTHLVGSVQRCMDITKVRIVTATVKNSPVILEHAVAGVGQSDLTSMIKYGVDPSRKVVMYFMKKFLESAPFHTVVFAVAHECAHLYLASKRTYLAFDEQSVDICAMMLGFAEYYEKGNKYVPGWHPLFSRFALFNRRVGYLHEEDIRAIRALFDKLRTTQARL